MIKVILLISVAILFSCNSKQKKNEFEIGNFYADVVHGITFKYNNNQAFQFRIGFVDSSGNYVRYYKEHLEMLEDNSGQKFGPSAPDYSYNKYGFTTDQNNIIWIEWSRLDDGKSAVGKIYSNTPQKLYIEAMQVWPGAPGVLYQLTETGFEGWLDLDRQSENPDWIFDVIENEKTASFASKADADSLQKNIIQEEKMTTSTDDYFQSAAISYNVSADNPLFFVTGKVNSAYTKSKINERLSLKQKEYNDRRFSVNTPMGEIWEAVSNHLNRSRVYGTQNKLTGHVVSRGWCNKYQQILYEWDSFFQAMLASLEDPEGARETVRAILFHQTSEGLVPNVTNGSDTTRNSDDRSQPPVGAICVWKMHQYHPDMKFLEEVYPKLLKWHNWWFDIRPENGLPYRDGNKNGLLEWGSETGKIQYAKYESGMDNSPMFDDARINVESRTLELDMAGLSGLWAADALYLSYIADALGKEKDAEVLRKQIDDINVAINDQLWNENVGMYCNKYWNDKSRKPKAEDFKSISNENFKGKIIRSYRNIVGDTISESVAKIAINNRELGYFIDNKIPIYWTATISPQKSGTYFFYTPEEMGVVLDVDGDRIIDNRHFFVTEFTSDPIHLEAGEEYRLSLRYTGDIPFELLWNTEQKTESSLFSERLSPTLFYPLIAGAPNDEKAELIINNLIDTTLFWGEYVIPTIARNDPAFPSQGYWRGRIWPPTNYLAYLGIKNYASDEVTWQFALKSAAIAQNEWVKHGQLHENYNANGWGTGTVHYCWGGLMQCILLEELAGFDRDGKLVPNPAAKGRYVIKNYPVKGDIIPELVVTGVYK